MNPQSPDAMEGDDPFRIPISSWLPPDARTNATLSDRIQQMPISPVTRAMRTAHYVPMHSKLCRRGTSLLNAREVGRLQLGAVDRCRGSISSKDLRVMVGSRGGVYIYDPVTERRVRIPWMHLWKANNPRGKIRNEVTLRMMSQEQKRNYEINEERPTREEIEKLPELTSNNLNDSVDYYNLRYNEAMKKGRVIRKQNPELGRQKMRTVLEQNRIKQIEKANQRRVNEYERQQMEDLVMEMDEITEPTAPVTMETIDQLFEEGATNPQPNPNPPPEVPVLGKRKKNYRFTPNKRRETKGSYDENTLMSGRRKRSK